MSSRGDTQGSGNGVATVWQTVSTGFDRGSSHMRMRVGYGSSVEVTAGVCGKGGGAAGGAAGDSVGRTAAQGGVRLRRKRRPSTHQAFSVGRDGRCPSSRAVE